MTFSEDRGSGRLAQWSPPPSPTAIATQPSQLTPADFMAGMASLQAAMENNAIAMAEFQRHQAAAIDLYRPAPAVAYQQPQPMQQWSQPPQHWQAPPMQQWHPPAPQPIHTTISPVIHIDASSRSHQDNGGGGWFGLLLGLGFLFALGSAALTGGGN